MSLILLVDTTEPKGRDLIVAYGRILTKHRYRNLEIFYLCHHTDGGLFKDILNLSPTLRGEEISLRVRGCLNGAVASAICLIGAKKLFLLFPEKLEAVSELYRAMGSEGSGESNGVHSSGQGVQLEAGLRNRHYKESGRSVGDTLGNTLGLNESSSDDDSQDSSGSAHHGSHPQKDRDQEDSSGSTHQRSPPQKETAHHGSHPQRHQYLLRQVGDDFNCWLERLADGTLQRHHVERWPTWN